MNFTERLNYYGFDLLHVSASIPSSQRQRRNLAVVDRRNGEYVCVYPTQEQVSTWLINIIPDSEFLD